MRLVSIALRKGPHDMVLPYQFIKLFRAPAACDYLVAFFHRGFKKSSDLRKVARGFFKNFALFENQLKRDRVIATNLAQS